MEAAPRAADSKRGPCARLRRASAVRDRGTGNRKEWADAVVTTFPEEPGCSVGWGMERANAVGLGVRGTPRRCWRAFGVALAVTVSVALSSACGSVTESASVVTCEAG